MSIDQQRDTEVATALKHVLELMASRKPNDRSDMDRIYAVSITDVEKAYCFFVMGSIHNKQAVDEQAAIKEANRGRK